LFTVLQLTGTLTVRSGPVVSGSILVVGIGAVALGIILIDRIARPMLNLEDSIQKAISAGMAAGSPADEHHWEGPLTGLPGDVAAGVAVGYQDERMNVAEFILQMMQKIDQRAKSVDELVKERTNDLSQKLRTMESRAIRLQSIAEAAHLLAAEQDLDMLLPLVTRVISEHFGYYHVGLFLLDREKKYAVLHAANSEGGRRMLNRGHRLKVNEVGIIGYVTGTGQARVALDVGEDAVYFNNPDLPATRSEVGLPLKVGDQIIGALDVQSTEPGAFSREDVAILETLADQVALTITNTRLISETRRTLKELQLVQSQYVEREWSSLVAQRPQRGYTYQYDRMIPITPGRDTPADPVAGAATGTGRVGKQAYEAESDGRSDDLYPPATPPDDARLWSELEEAQEGSGILVSNGENGIPPGLIVPIILRGRLIGMIHLEEENTASIATLQEARREAGGILPKEIGAPSKGRALPEGQISKHKWTNAEINLALAVAEQVGLALENARLLEVTQRRAERERLVSQITTRMRASNDPEAIMETAVSQLRQILGVQNVRVRIQAKEAVEIDDRNGSPGGMVQEV
jgi:GAF domain-containing protein